MRSNTVRAALTGLYNCTRFIPAVVVTATDVDVVFDVILGSGILEGVIVVIVIVGIDFIDIVLGWGNDEGILSSLLLSVTMRLMDLLLLPSSIIFVIDFIAALVIGDETEAPSGNARLILLGALRRRREGDSGRMMVLLSIAIVIDRGGVDETLRIVGMLLL